MSTYYNMSTSFGNSFKENNTTIPSQNIKGLGGKSNGNTITTGRSAFGNLSNSVFSTVPQPIVTEEVFQEEIADDIDENDYYDEMQVVEYVNEIYEYLYEKERSAPISPNFLAKQTDITSKMRAILVDWMVEVHELFKLISETLYRALDIADRFFEMKLVAKSKIQLVGVTAMLIASKFEEIYAPEIKDFIYITDSAYSEQEILSMEQEILRVLDFNIANPTPLHFLRRFSKAASSDYRTHTLCKYLIEISLLDIKMMNYYPSQIAAASVYIARSMATITPVWTTNLQHYSAYSTEDLKDCVLALNSVAMKVLRSIQRNELKSIYEKFASGKYGQVSLIPLIRNEEMLSQF